MTPTRRIVAASGFALAFGLYAATGWAQTPAPADDAGRAQRMEAVTERNKLNGEARAKSDAARDARINRLTGSICVGCGGPTPATPKAPKAAR